jgi:hypothetical protein
MSRKVRSTIADANTIKISAIPKDSAKLGRLSVKHKMARRKNVQSASEASRSQRFQVEGNSDGLRQRKIFGGLHTMMGRLALRDEPAAAIKGCAARD